MITIMGAMATTSVLLTVEAATGLRGAVTSALLTRERDGRSWLRTGARSLDGVRASW